MDKKAKQKSLTFIHFFNEGPIMKVRVTPKRVALEWYGSGTARIWEFENYCNHLIAKGYRKLAMQLVELFNSKNLGVDQTT